jgi:hypothetical protein
VKQEDQAMPVEVRQEGRRLLAGVIRGVLRKSELDAFQKAAADVIRRETTISCLIVLDGFEGWEHGADWGDVTFMERHDEALEKIAIVGPSEQEDDVMIFAAAPMRAGRVRYFSSESEARVWLGGHQ